MQLCNRIKKLWLPISFIAIGSLYLTSIYFDVNFETWRSGIDKMPLPQELNNSKTVLFWNTMFGDKSFYFGPGDVFENCPNLPKGSCYATHNRYALNIEDFDAVLFHGSELLVNDLPNKRRTEQRYIYTNLESPINHPLPYPIFENYFNLTMTYRLDSDIVWPYNVIREIATGEIIWPLHQPTLEKTHSATDVLIGTMPRKCNKLLLDTPLPDDMCILRLRVVWRCLRSLFYTAEDQPIPNVRRNSLPLTDFKLKTNKKKTAAWFVSNCNSQSGREKYVDELMKYVDVDIFGLCGNNLCKRNQDCFKTVVEPNYYFYLSFENSLCQDYVTEKLYNALKYEVIPVVYGGANYSLFAPPNSYINTLDFESPKHLAQYLKKLTKEPKEYAKYFKWKQKYEVSTANKITICQLCHYLLEDHEPKIYDPLSSWYSYKKCPLQEKLKFLPYVTKSALN